MILLERFLFFGIRENHFGINESKKQSKRVVGDTYNRCFESYQNCPYLRIENDWDKQQHI